jgi:hypothetical protein
MNTSRKKHDGANVPKERGMAMTLHGSVEFSEEMRRRIADKVYQLWEERGHRDGCDLEDWYRAEAIIREQFHEA